MKIFTLLALLLSTLTGFCQSESETIKKAKEFISDKKYETAFTLLDKFDPENNKPDIVLLKEEIVLDYFVSSMMHQMFSLKDINKNENILDYRGKDGVSSTHVFEVDSILNRLINIHPNNCKLYKGLADYYYEAHLKYGGRWLKDDAELLPLIQINFQKAVDGKCADYLSYYVLGYLNLLQEKTKESIPFFEKAVVMNKDHATSHYNLAYAYLYNDDRERSLKHAKIALDLYPEGEYKADAARMVGQVYTELNDDKNAITYYEIAYMIDPEYYYNIKSLLTAYVKTDHKEANEMTKAFFTQSPENPTIFNDLEEIYLSNKKEKDLITFYKSQSSPFKDNDTVQGGLNYYLARIYRDSDKKLAKDHFIKARTHFEKVFDKDHEVFEAIKEGLTAVEK